MTNTKIPMLFDRQKRLLALLDALDGESRKLDFQKLLFLYCQETGETAPYEFVPYKERGSCESAVIAVFLSERCNSSSCGDEVRGFAVTG